MSEKHTANHGYAEKGGEYRTANPAILDLITPILDKGNIVRFSAPGHSMLPFIHPEDVLSIQPILNKLAIGDVVAFVNRESGSLIIHRLIQRRGNSYTMKGDNRQAADQNVPRASLLGRVIEVERGGKIIRFGLGLERCLIGYLSRLGLLLPLVKLASRLLGLFRSLIQP